MNTASLELSQELFELSGWRTPNYVWTKREIGGKWQSVCLRLEIPDFEHGDYPAYDLGYLLRRLPPRTTISKNPNREAYGAWVAGMDDDRFEEADTPEDAACKLAIELIKQGILKI